MPDVFADTTFSPALLDAVLLATEAHAGQVRKGSGAPYVYHPLRVAKRVASLFVADEAQHRSMVLAAILHDVLEDTEVPAVEIGRRFGADVLELVEELTHDDLELPIAEWQQYLVVRCRSISKAAQVVKLADRLDNVIEMRDLPRDFIVRYVEETRELLRVMRGACPELELEILEVLSGYES